ncbi:MAG TPA: universal stress protein [Syntrophorhabdaceae bacterium]|nr:universal stress protein [Syntrophorhabdaceae bacterium]
MIPQIKKILYATDLTKNASYAFYFAVDMAQKHDAKIIILHCIEPLPPLVYGQEDFGAFEMAREQEKQEGVAKIKKRLQQFCKNAESQIGSPCVHLVSEVMVREGYPVEEILATADTKECDVIVLGTHGKGWLKQTFLGSTASSVLQRTRKPVLVIPLPSEKSGIEMGAL